ncbi:LLM class flavin-dependent oxidoreductase [Desertibacillus haloalkaliphilus]|uniref:LLM class flavin-dependent oxidoreductase n=1 Tax=Desertibacillus haloalkaliphilus TaxID=1328930 RepID=UPI001C27E18E|nr:LLM class flavin-dependent oxidoreductase [Desertibacillus haloalkaliphilus]MBU8905317.1 LLM class flavin-dependent oxidoreductase [Desertibacillus haloalkaliphilus]
MQLSILDQAPISANQTPKEALEVALKLAQLGETLGYTRYWIAEHHDLPGLACSAPEVMLAYLGANTNTIRIGSGATLLPHYKPYKVAEQFHMLATLFPDRIDLGIGRAPGGSAEATNALSDHFLQNVWDMPKDVQELLCFLDDRFPEGHEFEQVSATPLPPKPVQPWLLGTSTKSAELAAEYGINYTFGQFMSTKDGIEIVKRYRETFKPRTEGQQPKTIVTVSVVCAETTAKAEEIALSSLIWSIKSDSGEGLNGVPSIEDAKQIHLSEKEKQTLERRKARMVIGDPATVRQQLTDVFTQYQADEVMIVTITYDPKDKYESYRLIAGDVLVLGSDPH